MSVADRLKNMRLVPVVSLPSVEAGLRLAELLLSCRFSVMEITCRTVCAAEAMARISQSFPELTVIAGTVLTDQQADRVIDCGAEAIVSPGFTRNLAAHCRNRNIEFFPGVATPSEVQAAMEEQLFNLKFFPASLSGGIRMIELFRTIYQDVQLMPTGGISQDNLLDYLAPDNVICCGGTWLCPEKLMIQGRWDEIEKLIREAGELLENDQINQ